MFTGAAGISEEFFDLH